MKRQSNQTVQMQPTHSSQTLNALRNRSVYVSNIVVTVTAAGWCAIGFALGEMPIVYLALFMMGSTTLAILVTIFGHHTIVKILWFFAGLVTITGAFFVSHLPAMAANLEDNSEHRLSTAHSPHPYALNPCKYRAEKY